MLSEQLVFKRIGLKDYTHKAMRKLCFSKRQNESVELEIVLFDSNQKQI
jgi:hypothetical protein